MSAGHCKAQDLPTKCALLLVGVKRGGLIPNANFGIPAAGADDRGAEEIGASFVDRYDDPTKYWKLPAEAPLDLSGPIAQVTF